MRKNEQKKQKYIDDGHTIYSMEGLKPDRVKREDDVELNRRERFAAIRAAFETYLVPFVLTLLGFGVTFVLLYFWLK